MKDVFGLAPGTQYEWVVRAWCDISGIPKSDWTPLNIFVTSAATRLSAGEHQGPSFEHEESFFLNILPNPNDGQFKVHWKIPGQEEAKMTIYDVTGKLIHAMEIGDAQQAINLSPLAHGVYFIKMEADGEFLIRKLVVE